MFSGVSGVVAGARALARPARPGGARGEELPLLSGHPACCRRRGRRVGRGRCGRVGPRAAHLVLSGGGALARGREVRLLGGQRGGRRGGRGGRGGLDHRRGAGWVRRPRGQQQVPVVLQGVAPICNMQKGTHTTKRMLNAYKSWRSSEFDTEMLLISDPLLTAAAALSGHPPELLAVLQRRRRAHRRRRRRRRVLQPRVHGHAAAESSSTDDDPYELKSKLSLESSDFFSMALRPTCGHWPWCWRWPRQRRPQRQSRRARTRWNIVGMSRQRPGVEERGHGPCKVTTTRLQWLHIH